MKESTPKDQLIEKNTSEVSKDEIPIKEEPKIINVKQESKPKPKKKRTPAEIKLIIARRQRRFMYLTLCIYLILSFLCIYVQPDFLKDKINYFFTKEPTLSLLICIATIAFSFILSMIVCYYDCLIKTHFFGILFLIILNICNDYSIIYGIHILEKPDFFVSSLIVMISGSLGLFLAACLFKTQNISICYLLFFNGLCAFGAGAVLFEVVYPCFLTLVFCSIAFIITEFNTYSSLYKFVIVKVGNKKVSKRQLKKTMIYSQPFELNISIYKFIAVVFGFILKLLKACCKNCCENLEIKDDGENTGEAQAEN